MWLLNKDEEITNKLTLISAVHTEVINAENTLTFECVEVVQKMDRVIYRDDLNKYHEFVIQDVVESRDSNIVYAEHSAYEMHGDFVEDKRPTGTARTHLEAILGKARWKLGNIEGTPSLFGTYYNQSVYKSINDMCALFNVYREFEIVVKNGIITDRLIHIKKEVGFDDGKRFVYSKDLQGVSRNVLMGDVITALYGFGKGEEIGDGYGRRINFSTLEKVDSPIGQKYVTDEPARLEWGRNSPEGKQHVFTSYEFDDIEDVEELYEATKAKLQELKVPRINYSADVILLADKHENVGIGDTVAIIDNDFRGRELRLKGKVFKIERDLIDGTKSVVELGNYIDDLSDANTKLNKFVNNFRDKTGIWDRSNAFDENGALDSSLIKNILEGWNNQMNGTSGFVYGNEGEGLITYDRAIDDNPTMAIQIVGGGWRIANSKLENGEWDWRTLGTGDGIYGDQIIADTITVNQLQSDVGSNLDISSNNAINQIVTQIDETTGLLQEEISSQVQQTADSFNVIFNKLESDQNLTNGEIELIQSYFRINENGVIIGKSNSAIEFFAENNRVGFRENGNDIAYWEEGTMNVERLIAITTIMVGYHLIEKYDSSVAGKTTIVRISD